MWKPAGDTIVVEAIKDESLLALPENREFSEEDVWLVKDVGIGYVTEQGIVISPEVKAGDKCIIKGKVLRMMIKGQELLLVRAQDIVAYERE
jgi:co-chaperonin GroES (HSP10)